MAFLVFEGIDASGKSTLLDLLCKELKKTQLPFVKTREPGGTTLGKKIREILLDKQNTNIDRLAESLLYYVDRKLHIKECIQPALEKGLWVLSDRYWASTEAYQCGARGVSEEFIKSLQKTLCGDLEPDLWILLDLPVDISLKRMKETRKDHRDRFEMEKKDFHEKVRNHYLKLAKNPASQWLILDATKPPQELLKQLLNHHIFSGKIKIKSPSPV